MATPKNRRRSATRRGGSGPIPWQGDTTYGESVLSEFSSLFSGGTPKNKRRKAKVNLRKKAKVNLRRKSKVNASRPSDVSIRFPRRKDSNISTGLDEQRIDARSRGFVKSKLRGMAQLRPESHVTINPETRQIDITRKPKSKPKKGIRIPRLPLEPRKKNDLLGRKKVRKV